MKKNEIRSQIGLPAAASLNRGLRNPAARSSQGFRSARPSPQGRSAAVASV